MQLASPKTFLYSVFPAGTIRADTIATSSSIHFICHQKHISHSQVAPQKLDPQEPEIASPYAACCRSARRKGPG
jgi:hypothetical protein